MKTVKSSDALKGLALARGASASFKDGQFNSSGEKVQTKKPEPKPEPKVEPKPETKAEPPIEFKPEIIVQDVFPAVQASIDAIGQYASKVDDLSRSNAKVMSEVQKVLEKVSAPTTSKPTAWVMKVERDTRGLLTQIIATPKE